MKRLKTTHFRILGMFVLFAGLTLTSCKDSSTSAIEEEDIASSAESMGVMMNSSTTTNVYISDSNTDTYDPLFPATAASDWQTSVCYQGNSFGINATWSNPHKAFEVTQDNGNPHPWESNTFDAYWINAVDDMDSPDTKDINGNAGPDGHNWTRYDKQVAGNGDFVVQLLADNCSWVYLADENGNSPQLVGYQGAVSTPGEYGVVLDGNHTLIFVIYDGGGAAGGKFRLETTENPPPPIVPEEPEVITYTSQAGIKTWEPIIVDRRSDFSTSQCTDDGALGPHVVGINDTRWVRTNNIAFSVRDKYQEDTGYNELTFERAYNQGLDVFDADWINAKDSPWSRNTYPTGYTGTTPLPDGKANWTKYELPVEGNGTFELKLLADDCSWVYLDGQVVGYQDNSGLSDPNNLRYGLTLDGEHTLTFVIFDQGGEAGGKFILETTTDDVPEYDPPTPVNNAPVADAGEDQTLDATGQTTPVTLDGSGSSDLDGDELTYTWSNGATGATPTINLPDGSHTLTLTVSDGEESDTDEVTITVVNTIPVADAGPNQTKEATGPTTSVTLTGSGSDADGDALTYSWSNGDTGTSTTVNLGVGVHTFTLTVSDGQGASDSDDVTITITDTTAPVLSFSQETSSLWPPNHKMVLVATGISASDIVDGSTDVTVTVSSNESSNGKGDGNTDSDYDVVTNPDGTQDVYVRSERSGKGNGRTYTITISTSDVAGNSSSESFEVQVAKSQGRAR